MNYDWKIDLRPRSHTATTTLPPALIEEAAWDILLALHADQERKLSVDKFAALPSYGLAADRRA